MPKVINKVLIIVDENTDRRRVCRFLENATMEVHYANIGKEAVELASRQEFDVMIVACSVSDLSDFNASQLIQSQQSLSGRRIPVVAIASVDELEKKSHLLDKGVDDMVANSAEFEEVEAIVSHYLPTR